jgi:hypothetical protein
MGAGVKSGTPAGGKGVAQPSRPTLAQPGQVSTLQPVGATMPAGYNGPIPGVINPGDYISPGINQPIPPQVPPQGGKFPGSSLPPQVPAQGGKSQADQDRFTAQIIASQNQPQQSQLQQMGQPGQQMYSGLGMPLQPAPVMPRPVMPRPTMTRPSSIGAGLAALRGRR